MKATCDLGLSYLLLFLVTFLAFTTAAPTSNTATSIVNATVQAPIQPPTLSDIQNLATDLFAVQLIGAQVNYPGINYLCSNFNTSRLQAEGYNVTTLHDVFCQASNTQNHGITLDEIRQFTQLYSSYIWIFQAVGALKGDAHRLNILCHLIDIPGADSVGQFGGLVKENICDLARDGGSLPLTGPPFFTL
ncbi:MAG: hypothetical protein Q9170_004347 [Blastenia crenularia]